MNQEATLSARTSQISSAAPCLAAMVEGNHKRLLILREQLETAMTQLDPSPAARSTDPRPVRAGVYGTVQETADVISDLTAIADSISRTING